MSNTQIVQIDTIRTLLFSSTGASYVAVGDIFVNPVRLIVFTNNTDGDMLFSDDGVNDKKNRSRISIYCLKNTNCYSEAE